METKQLKSVLSLKDCGDILGLGKSGTHKRLRSAGISMEKNEQGKLEINASVFAGKFPEETAAWQKGVSVGVSKNDNGNNGKPDELNQMAQELAMLKQELSFEKQRHRDKDDIIEDLRRDKERLTAIMESKIGQLPLVIADMTKQREEEKAAAEGKKSWLKRLLT